MVGSWGAVWVGFRLLVAGFGDTWGGLLADNLPTAVAAPLTGGLAALGLGLVERWTRARWPLVLVGALLVVALVQLTYEAAWDVADHLLGDQPSLSTAFAAGVDAIPYALSMWTSGFGLWLFAFQWAAVVAVTTAGAAGVRLRWQLLLGPAVALGCYVMVQDHRGGDVLGQAVGAQAHVFARALLFPCASAIAAHLARESTSEEVLLPLGEGI